MDTYTQHSLLPISNEGRFTVGIFGSAIEIVEPKIENTAKMLGCVLGSMGLTVATGGCLGLPAIVARNARASGSRVLGFFPDLNEMEATKNRIAHANDSEAVYDAKYFAKGYTQRSLCMIQNIDCAVVVGGRIGTLSEWTMALEEGVPILALKNTGGIAAHLEYILSVAKKEFPNNYISFSGDVILGVSELIAHTKKLTLSL